MSVRPLAAFLDPIESPVMRKFLPYIGGFCSACWYAWRLEQRPRKYHPDVTIWNVTKGIAMTGGWVALRIAQGAPSGSAQQGAWWTWCVTFWMFVATGAPMTAVELWQHRERLRSLLRYGGRRANQTPPAGG